MRELFSTAGCVLATLQRYDDYPSLRPGPVCVPEQQLVRLAGKANPTEVALLIHALRTQALVASPFSLRGALELLGGNHLYAVTAGQLSAGERRDIVEGRYGISHVLRNGPAVAPATGKNGARLNGDGWHRTNNYTADAKGRLAVVERHTNGAERARAIV